MSYDRMFGRFQGHGLLGDLSGFFITNPAESSSEKGIAKLPHAKTPKANEEKKQALVI